MATETKFPSRRGLQLVQEARSPLSPSPATEPNGSTQRVYRYRASGKKTRTEVQLEPRTRAQVDQLAKAWGVSRGEVVDLVVQSAWRILSQEKTPKQAGDRIREILK